MPVGVAEVGRRFPSNAVPNRLGSSSPSPVIGVLGRHVSDTGGMHEGLDWRHVNRFSRIIAGGDVAPNATSRLPWLARSAT